MSWPNLSLYDSMLREMNPGLSPIPPPVPPPVPSPLPSPEPGSLSPVAPTPRPLAVPKAPPAALVRSASPLPRFEMPEPSSEASKKENPLVGLMSENPLQGLMPSEDVRIKRMGMMHAGAAMAAAADSGHGFAGAVAQGILAGNMAAEDMRARFAAARLKQLEARSKFQSPTRGRIDWGDRSQAHLREEQQRHEDQGWHESSEAIGKEIARMNPVHEADGHWRDIGDGTEQLFMVDPGTAEAVPVEGMVRHKPKGERRPTRQHYVGPNLYRMAYADEEGGFVNDFVYQDNPSGDWTRDDPIKAARESYFGGTLDDLASAVAGGRWVEDPAGVVNNVRTGFGESGLDSLSDFIEHGDPQSEHALVFNYMTGLDGSVVREGEVALLRNIASMINIPENKWDQFMRGSLVSEEARLGMVLFNRVKGARAVDLVKGDREYWSYVGSKRPDWDEEDLVHGLGDDPTEGVEELFSAADSEIEKYLMDNGGQEAVDKFRSMLQRAGQKAYGFKGGAAHRRPVPEEFESAWGSS